MATSKQHPSEATFRSYTPAQAATYSAGRPAYPDALNRIVCEHHAQTGGQFTLFLDVGCGPGNATRSLSPHFTHAIGADPSVEMINAARSIPSITATEGQPVRFEVCTSETLHSIPDLVPRSVDLLTAATAAHWFDMPVFWTQAAKMLKPGGTVALWTGASWYCHPHTTPNAKKVQAVLHELEDDVLGPYEVPGNRLSRDMYVNLPLPWDVEPIVVEFPKEEFVRMEWNRDGKVEEGETFFRGGQKLSLDDFVKGVSTASMVTRWREAHPELVGTDQDCVVVTKEKLREALGGRDWFEAGSGTVVLLFKKRV